MPWRVKKNVLDNETIELTILISWYEQLRDYVISPCKTLSTPLGLDLWIKKGFKGWMKILVSYKSDYKDKKGASELIRSIDSQHGTVPEESRKELTFLITNMILSRG